MNIYLTETEKDALKEIGNIGIGNAATAISKLINKKVKISLTKIELEKTDNIELESNDLVGTKMLITGDIGGVCTVIFDKKQADILVCDVIKGQKMTEQQNQTKEVLNETANIIAGAYLSSLGDFLSKKMFPQIPQYFDKDTEGMDIRRFLTNINNQIISIGTSIEIDDDSLKGYFFISFDQKSLMLIIHEIHRLVINDGK